jgi:molecular chaperone HtpG
MSSEKTTFEFKTEAKQLLDLMIHSVYSHREIFLRELISNASDALDKLRFEALTHDNLRGMADNLHIRLEADKNERLLKLSDNGIGMSRDELVQYIGTIAKSGTKEYANALKDAQGKGLSQEFIGQFGVGFYSSFMVADHVTVITRRAGEEIAHQWESQGDGTYSIVEATRDTCGTTVILKMKAFEKDEDAEDFTEEWVLRQIVRKYSDFVAYPIKMKTERREMERDADGKTKEGGKEIVTIDDQTLNSMKAIWTRPEKEVTEAEYKEFYKHISHDWTDPLKWFTFKAEGTSNEFRALMYFPSKAMNEMFMDEKQRGIHLYIKRVFIMNDCKELIPEYLRFMRGVVDSEDLSLNISREILQQNRQIGAIRGALTRKILDTLKNLKNDTKEQFLTFWKEFGRILKEGLFKEPGDRERLFEVCLFQSTHSADEYGTLEDYTNRMKSDQNTIYFLTGESRAILEQSPHLETFKAKGYEVLLLTDPVDEVWVQFAHEHKGKKFQNAAKGAVQLGTDEEQKKVEEELQQKATEYKSMLEFFKTALSEHVKEVRFSSRLTSSPACIVGEANDMSTQLEALLKASGKEVPKVKRTLELNPNHPVIGKLKAMFDADQNNPLLKGYAELLFGQALLADGSRLPNISAFSNTLSDVMVKAIG